MENKDKDIVYYKYLYSDQLHLLGADRYYQLEEEFVKATKFIPERYIKLMTDKNYLEIAGMVGKETPVGVHKKSCWRHIIL